jgi:hypothetical protein
MILFGGIAAVLVVFWLRVRFHRTRFKKAVRAMNRGGTAQRASTAFWKVVGLAVLIMAIRVYLEMHAR